MASPASGPPPFNRSLWYCDMESWTGARLCTSPYTTHGVYALQTIVNKKRRKNHRTELIFDRSLGEVKVGGTQELHNMRKYSQGFLTIDHMSGLAKFRRVPPENAKLRDGHRRCKTSVSGHRPYQPYFTWGIRSKFFKKLCPWG